MEYVHTQKGFSTRTLYNRVIVSYSLLTCEANLDFKLAALFL